MTFKPALSSIQLVELWIAASCSQGRSRSDWQLYEIFDCTAPEFRTALNGEKAARIAAIRTALALITDGTIKRFKLGSTKHTVH